MTDRTVRMYNPTHRFDTSTETAPTSDPAVAWSHEFQDEVGEVAVWGDIVYFGVGESLVAIGQDGNSRWRFNTGDRTSSSPTVVDGTVFVGSYDGNVYALDAATGREQWTFETDGAIYSPPVVVDGTVFIGNGYSQMYALEGPNTQLYQTCSNCGATLSEYGNPSFCPECGTETAASGNSDTEVYDP